MVVIMLSKTLKHTMRRWRASMRRLAARFRQRSREPQHGPEVAELLERHAQLLRRLGRSDSAVRVEDRARHIRHDTPAS